MNENESMIVKILIKRGIELHNKPRELIQFSGNAEADKLSNNIEEYPHFFVLGCVVDRLTDSTKAWVIPFRISRSIGSIEFSSFLKLDLKSTENIISENSLHWAVSPISEVFFKAIQKIHIDYDDNASNLWTRGNPTCHDVIRRFDDFYGVGQKISSMAVNILVRDFKVPLHGKNAIDISIDTHIKRVFKRMGLVKNTDGEKGIINYARSVYPEYPGIFDSVCWELGKLICKHECPTCSQCYLTEYCPKIIE